MYRNIIDTHAHYDDCAFDPDRDEIISSLPGQGICAVINCGTNETNSLAAVELTRKYSFFYAAAGVHPSDCLLVGENWLDEIKTLLADEKCVAVGEIGLDYHYDDTPRDLQLEFFEKQLRLSLELSLPVIIHDREAHADTMSLLKKYRPKGVLHCFSGSVETMNEALSLGLYIGFGGAVTFKNAKKPLECAACVPSDRLLLETDCPYMTPVPHRGKRNYSGFIPLSAEAIAQARGTDAQTLIDAAAQNARVLFGIQ